MSRGRFSQKVLVGPASFAATAQSAAQSVLGTVPKAKFLAEIIAGRKIGKTGYGFTTDKNGLILAHPVPEHILKLDVTKLADMAAFVKRMLAGEKGVEDTPSKELINCRLCAPVGYQLVCGGNAGCSGIFKSAHSIRNLSILLLWWRCS